MNFELVEKEKLVGKLNQGVEYYKGDKGDAFKYEDFTPEQLESLRGPKGDAFTYEDFTQEQLNALKGQDGYTPQKGIDYFDGSNGLDGKDGKDGVSITHTWNGTSLSITSASGTSEMDLRGPAGQDGYTPIKGVDYFDGEPGPAGQDYVLTEDDKTAIANIVIGVLPTAEGVNV